MEERINPQKTGKLKSNITRFRQDKRLAVTGAIYSLALLGMLATVVFCIFRYQDDLNLANLKRLVSYAKAIDTSGDPFTEYEFDAGLSTVYAPFGSGLAVCTGDTYSFVSGLSGSRFSIQLGYARPAICTSNNKVLLYDRGNYSFCVANSYTEYLRETLKSPILSASINEAGAFSLVTNEEGYRSAVTVYSDRQNQLCKWMTSQYYVLFSSVSPDSSAFAALCMSQGDLSMNTQVLYFRIGETEAAWTADLGQRQVYSMTHDKSGDLVILCDDGLYTYGSDGTLTGSLAFTEALQRFSSREGEDTLLAFTTASRSEQTADVMVVGARAAVLYHNRFSGTLRSLALDGGSACVLLGDRIETIRYEERQQPVTETAHSGARNVIVETDGTPILIYSDRAQRLSPKEENLP